jgi:hypothetical protein
MAKTEAGTVPENHDADHGGDEFEFEVEDGEILEDEETDGTAAEGDEDSGADQDSGKGDAGDDAGDDDGGTGDDDGAGGDDDGEGSEKGGHQKNRDDRITELARENRELKTAFEQFKKDQSAGEKPFIELNMTAVKQEIERLQGEANTLTESGDLFKAAQKQREATKILDAVDENAAKKQEWEKNQSESANSTTSAEAMANELTDAAEFFRKTKKIPVEVFNKAGDMFWEMAADDELIGRQYLEIAQRQGATAAVNFAYGKVTTKMEAENTEVTEKKEKKEKGKNNQPGGKGGGGGDKISVKSYDDWLGLKPKERDAFRTKHPKEYKRMHDKHIDEQV